MSTFVTIIEAEKSLIYGQKISGHFTQGHVDTTGKANNYVLSWIDATQQWEPRSVAAAQGNLTEGDAIAFAIALGS